MTVVTRFAPSPTGRLHVGNVRAALHNHLWARKHGGRFILRIDDTDAERSREHYVQAIRDDLTWLGLQWDAEYRQSQRFALYENRFAALKASGRVYACYETAEELDLRRKVLLGRGLPPIYERKPVDAPIPENRSPHWRFRLDHDSLITWHDLVRGEQCFDPKLLSDPVIRREDGSWLYMLPSAIDDTDLQVSHVVRGEDHVTNTAVQVQMFAALGATPPEFGHAALLTGSDGKLSKRLGSLSVEALRERGVEPISLLALLARLGTSDAVTTETEIAPLIAGIDFSRFGRAPARFDEDELTTLNARTLHLLDYAAVADRLPEGMDARGWEAIRPNIATLDEVEGWWRVVTGPVESEAAPDDLEFIACAAALLPSLDWSADPWHALTSALKVETGRSGKALFLPLRRALTGRDHGPDMKALLPLIGLDRALARLS